MTPHRRPLFALCFLAPMLTTVCACQTPPPQPPPGVVARVTAAKTVFLSNAGANDYFANAIHGGPNLPYNELYAALQQWGYFHLVDSPAHADLIFQIRGTEPMPGLATNASGRIVAQQHAPQLELTILDPHTLTPIDTLSTPAGRAKDVSKDNIAFAQSVEWLTYRISTLVAAPRPNSQKLNSAGTLRPSFESIINSVAPIPPQVLSAKTIFLQTDARAKDPYYKGFQSALTTWGYYHLVDSASAADLVLNFHDDEANGISITLEAPTSKAILWTITDPHHGFYPQTGEHRIATLNQNLISELKKLNNLP
jgi:hypothetical protein